MRRLIGVALLAGLAASAAWAEEPWTLGPFRKDDGANPILGPSPNASFSCPIRRATVRWEELAIYNPAAVVRDGQVLLVYRAQDKDGTSRLGLATSRDGVRFARRAAPVLFPDEDRARADEWPGGCEDPRLVEDDRGRAVLTYTAYDGQKARLAVATSKDLVRWTKHGLAFGAQRRDLWSKSGAIVCRWRGSRCVAERVGGHYWMLWGDTSIFAATSDDLTAWTPLLGDDGRPAPVIAPRPGRFDSELVEPGPAAFLTRAGIVLLYNARNAVEGGDPGLRPGAYAAGQVLLDASDPRRVLARPPEPFLRPDLGHEKEGQVANVVFVEGLVPFRGRWLLYFGTADSRLAVAAAPLAPGPSSPLDDRK
jgi:beta-1,2-mannosidase